MRGRGIGERERERERGGLEDSNVAFSIPSCLDDY